MVMDSFESATHGNGPIMVRESVQKAAALAGWLIIISAVTLQSFAASPIRFYGCAKEFRYFQSNSQSLVARTNDGFLAMSFLYGAAVGSVTMPNGTVRQLPVFEDHLELAEKFASVFTLNFAWPNGTYAMNMTNAADGPKHSMLSLVSDAYPAPVQVSNFDAAQQISAVQAFTLTWSFPGGPASDLLHVRIEENGVKIFESSPIPDVTGALNLNSTSFTIPANTLAQGRVYDCLIRKWRAVTRDTTTISGTLGESAYISETALKLRTRFELQDVSAYTFEKSVNYEQTTTDAPVLRQNAYEIGATILAQNSNSVISASFKAPNGASQNFSAGSARLRFSQAFATSALLDAGFGSGAYAISMNTKNNGLQTNSLPLTGDAYPGTPRISNIDAAQFMVASAPFTLSWSINGALSTDLIQVTIAEAGKTVFAAPEVADAPGALPGTAISVTIPAGTLVAGHSYQGIVRCFRAATTDSQTYLFCSAYAGYARATQFPLLATDGVLPQPTISSIARTNNQTLFSFTSTRGGKYSVQRVIPDWKWTNAMSLIASGSVHRVAIPDLGGSNGFFRVVAGQ
jgi:hypothetical protein